MLILNILGEHEKDLPETRRGFDNTGTCDQFNFIFKDLHKLGYTTMFSEDDPKYATFNYRLNGFTNPPTTWYLRPYWLGQMKYNNEPLCVVEYNMHILKEFTMANEEEAKFSITTNARIAHNDLNNLQLIDNDLVDIIEFFKEPKRVDNTVFIRSS